MFLTSTSLETLYVRPTLTACHVHSHCSLARVPVAARVNMPMGGPSYHLFERSHTFAMDTKRDFNQTA